MFNLGFMEIVVIGVLALLLIGPKQLPEVAKVLGRMINEFKKATTELSGGLLEMKEELKKPVQEGLTVLTDIQDAVYDDNLSVTVDLEETIKKHTALAEDDKNDHEQKS